jgi:cold shock protein
MTRRNGGLKGEEMATGIVKFFNNEKAYGFIAPDDGGADMFVHISGLKALSTLVQGQAVAYDVESNTRNGRPKAINVRLL